MGEPMTRTMTLSEGNYKVVSFALDLTGKKLIDEICHIGAFIYPDKAFSQYVMPHRDVSQSATRIHGIRVFINFGRFRVLKDVRSMKTLRTKSEFSTLNEFIDWLKKAAKETDGIILAYHDNNLSNVVPFFMEALRRYKLTDEFFSVVKAFVNCHTIAMEQVELKDRSITLRALLRKVLEYDEDKLSTNPLESARKRAQLTYQVMAKIFKIEGEIPSDLVKNYVTGRDQELANLEKQIILANKVKTLRPIFVDQIRKGTKERSRAVALRRYLIEIETEYDILQSVYKTGSRDGIVKLVGSAESKKKKQDLEDLVDLIMRHFSGEIVKADVNDNKIITKEEVGGGDAVQLTKASTSSSDTDEDEYEEAKDDEDLEVGTTDVTTDI